LLCLVALSTNRAVETYILNVNFGPTEVGIFIVAATLFRASLDLVSVGLNAVLMPVLGHGLGEGGIQQVKNITQRTVKYMFFIGLLFSGCSFFFADPLVILLYGDNYKDSAQAFKILTLIGGVTITSGIFGAYLSFTDKQQSRAVISLAGAIMQCIAAIVVVPKYGIWGAVASTSIGMIATHALLIYTSTKNHSLSLPNGNLISIFIAFLFSLYITNIFYNQLSSLFPKILTGICFGIGLTAVSIAFKYWTKLDYMMLNKMFNQGTRSSKIITALEKYSS
jgi:O-antigen/teichoic acid export membrane protein